MEIENEQGSNGRSARRLIREKPNQGFVDRGLSRLGLIQ